MIEKIGVFATHLKWLVITLFIIFTIAFALLIPNIKIDSSLRSMMPDDYPAEARIEKIEGIFGGTEYIVITFQSEDVVQQVTLQRIKKITRSLERIKNVEDVISLTNFKDIRGEYGSLIVDPLVKRIPKSKQRQEILREKIKDNDMIYGEIVARDFTATGIIAVLEKGINDEEIVGAISKIVEDNPGDEETHIGGLPAIRAVMSKQMLRDVSIFVPCGLLIMLIFLYLCFREIRGVFLPFLVVVMSIIISAAFIVVFGWKFQIITMLLPVFLIAVANDYGIHIIAQYQEENLKPDIDKNQVLKNVIKSMTLPIMAAGITTISGLLCLQSHVIVPAKQVGVLSTIGLIFALLGSLLLIPAVLTYLPRSKYKKNQQSSHFLENILIKTTRQVNNHPGRTLIISIIFVAICIIGTFRINVDTNMVKFFKKDSEIYRTDQIVRKYFGGSSSISVIAKGDIKDPKVMEKIHWLTKKMEAREMLDNVSSISKVICKINKVMHDDNEEFDRIPKTRELIAQYFLLYNMSGDPEDFEKLVDFNYENALITSQISSSSNDILGQEFNYVNNIISEQEDSPFTVVGGYAEMEIETINAIVKGQLLSLFISLFIVAGIVALFFKSAVAGALSALPLSIAIAILFGLMGFFGIDLNVATAMLSAIMIGVGVDYTIHFLWRYRSEIQNGKSLKDAVETTLTTTGRGIIYNALSVIVGFLVLFLSGFRPLQYFGFLIMISISACLVGALMILPSICLIFKPKFLEN